MTFITLASGAKVDIGDCELIDASELASLRLVADQHIADVSYLGKQLATATAERDEARKQAMEEKGWRELSDDAHGAVRRLLDENGVPSAAFIDDNVGNAIWQRNMARQRGDTYRNRALALLTQVDYWRTLDRTDAESVMHAIRSREAAELALSQAREETERCMAALKAIQEMAEDDLNHGITGNNSLLWQIEADARAALSRPSGASGGEREQR